MTNRIIYETLLKSIVVLGICGSGFVIGGDTANPKNAARGAWVQPLPDKVVRSAGCDITESLHPQTLRRVDNVQCPGEIRAHSFYFHDRIIAVLIGNNHRFALLNDAYATKSSRVVLVNLINHSRIDVSSNAQRLYRRDVTVNPSVVVQPEGYAFSPNESAILVKVSPTYFSVSSAVKAKQLARSAETRWYVLSTDDGHVVNGFRGEEPPVQ